MNRRQLLGTAFVAPFMPMEQDGEIIEPIAPDWMSVAEAQEGLNRLMNQVVDNVSLTSRPIFPVNSYGVK